MADPRLLELCPPAIQTRTFAKVSIKDLTRNIQILKPTDLPGNYLLA